jgi:hypothetical protein
MAISKSKADAFLSKIKAGLSLVQLIALAEEMLAFIESILNPTPTPVPTPTPASLMNKAARLAGIAGMAFDTPTTEQQALQQLALDIQTAIADQVTATSAAAQVVADQAALTADTAISTDAEATFQADISTLATDFALVQSLASAP